MPEDMRVEVEVAADERNAANLMPLGTPSLFTCPECHGSLLQLDGPPVRYRCHTGHAYTALSLEDELREKVENTTWSAIRSLQEHAMLLNEMAEDRGLAQGSATQFRSRGESAVRRAGVVRRALVDEDGTSNS